MKRLAALILLALTTAVAVGAAAYAGPGRPGPPDGTLTIKGGIGRIVIDGTGVVIGRFDRGQVTIKDPNPNDGPAPVVTGAEVARDLNEKTTRYSGTDVAFRVIGGRFSVIIVAANIDLAVKGRATVTLVGRGTEDDGTFAVNDGVAQQIPDFPLRFQLVGTAPQPAPGG